MLLLRLFEFIAIVIAVVTIVSQILVPVLTGRKLFPAFRSSRNHIEDAIREAQEQLDEKQLQEHLEELQTKLKTPSGPIQQ